MFGNYENYKVNPAYLRYYKNYKNIYNEYYTSERKIKNGNASKEEIEENKELKRQLNIVKNNLNNAPRVVFGGNMKKEDALSKTNGMHIDFLA